MRYLLLTVFLMTAIMSGQTMAEDKPLATNIRVAGHPCKAKTAEQFILLTQTVENVNALRRERASGKLDEQEYKYQLALHISTLVTNGVRIN